MSKNQQKIELFCPKIRNSIFRTLIAAENVVKKKRKFTIAPRIFRQLLVGLIFKKDSPAQLILF